jgi:thiol:disulfide interchange protein
MNRPRLTWLLAAFLVGLVFGVSVYQAVLAATGRTVVASESIAAEPAADPHRLPYRSDADPRKDLAEASQRAARSGKLVMVTFGANWCPDCQVLHTSLYESPTREYAQQNFEFVNVDVGWFDRNLDLALELGVKLDGIPVAVFLAPGREAVGNTNRGELEASREYSSKLILAFLREVVERRRVVFPQDAACDSCSHMSQM